MHAPAPAVQASSEADSASFEVRNLGFRAGERVLLDSISFDLAVGEVIGLIGHNGSGKTTLLRLLARQQGPSSGEIRFQGKALSDWPRRAFARKVAFLPQTPAPATGLTVRELVSFGRYPWHGALGRFGEEDRQRVEDAMRMTDVAAFADRLVETLSGGERQRAWLAMLMAQDADCLLLDEPISALDVSHQIEVMRLVRQLSRDHGVGVVVVLHDVNLAARFCDSLVALRGGRLLVQGPPSAVMNGETLTRIYGIPMDVIPGPVGGHPLGYVR